MKSAPTKLLTLAQAQALFGINRKTLWDLTARGVVPCVRLPGVRRVFVIEADVQRLIERSTEREF
jgi:predicted DNA-binding transcriptional regulator AlpA